jgi:acyl-CoA thioesterase-1
MAIKNYFLFLFLLFVIIGCSNSKDINDSPEINFKENNSNNFSQSNNSQYENNYDTVIVAFGDSLTQGLGVDREDSYPSQLERELIKLGYKVKVYNSGLSGETTTGALNRVEWVLQLEPDIVILTIGANDAIRGLDLNMSKSNINKIIDILEKNNITIIFSGMEIYENLGESYTSNFKNLYFEIAEDRNLTFIPFFLEGVAGNFSLNNDDRIHPNKEGYKYIVKNNILPVLIPILEAN